MSPKAIVLTSRYSDSSSGPSHFVFSASSTNAFRVDSAVFIFVMNASSSLWLSGGCFSCSAAFPAAFFPAAFPAAAVGLPGAFLFFVVPVVLPAASATKRSNSSSGLRPTLGRAPIQAFMASTAG